MVFSRLVSLKCFLTSIFSWAMFGYQENHGLKTFLHLAINLYEAYSWINFNDEFCLSFGRHFTWFKQDVLKGRKTGLTISGAGGSVRACCDPVLLLDVVMICCCCCCCWGSSGCRGAWWRPAGRRGYWTGRRTPSSPRNPGHRESCCRGGRTGPRHRTCGRTPDRRSTPGGRRWCGPSSPSQRRGWSSCRRRSSPWSQTAWGSPACRGGGYPWCTGTGPPRPAWRHSTRTWDTPRASRGPGPGDKTHYQLLSTPAWITLMTHLEDIFVVYFLVTACALLNIWHLALTAPWSCWHACADHLLAPAPLCSGVRL